MSIPLQMGGSCLPKELWQIISKDLSVKELGRLSQVSKGIHHAVMTARAPWIEALKREGKYVNAFDYFPLRVVLNAQKKNMLAPQFLSRGK